MGRPKVVAATLASPPGGPAPRCGKDAGSAINWTKTSCAFFSATQRDNPAKPGHQ